MAEDRRRQVPRTDALLALPVVAEARRRLAEAEIREVVVSVQQAVREGRIAAEAAGRTLENELRDHRTSSLTPVLNATGVVVHTNLGRAPLSPAAQEAVQAAAGYVDVEMDLVSGKRSARGQAARAALLRACPEAEDALIVNNGAAALLLAVTALGSLGPGCGSRGEHTGQEYSAHPGRGLGEMVVSRGELVEIGAGFRLPDLMVATGVSLREVGTTNRTRVDDYEAAICGRTVGLVKIHPSNFRVSGFTAEASIAELRPLADEHSLPLIADLGSGLLRADPLLPDEPDISSALRAGADVVIVSGDKLFGGAQAGLLLGRREVIRRLAKHPLARAVRSDKLTLAAIEATLRGSQSPVTSARHADPARLRARAERLASRVDAAVVPHDGRVGGGGAPGVPLSGWAVDLPEEIAGALRLGSPAVVGRVHRGRCLVDLRCVPEEEDDRLIAAVELALAAVRANHLSDAGSAHGGGHQSAGRSAGTTER